MPEDNTRLLIETQREHVQTWSSAFVRSKGWVFGVSWVHLLSANLMHKSKYQGTGEERQACSSRHSSRLPRLLKGELHG